MKTVVAILLIIGLGYFFVLRSFSKDRVSNEPSEPAAALRPHPAANPSGADDGTLADMNAQVLAALSSAAAKLPEIKELNPEKKLGAAGQIVREFFKNWEFTRYADMHAQTVFSRELGQFVTALTNTPINYRNLDIGKETRKGKDWTVEISLEVTSLASAIGACEINLMRPRDPTTSRWPMKLSPRFLGIEEFAAVKQTWTIADVNGRLFIDVGAKGSKNKRCDNIMNYVLDTAFIDVLPIYAQPPGHGALPIDEQINTMAMWTAFLRMDLNVSVDEAGAAIKKATPLRRKAIVMLNELAKQLARARSNADEPSVPAAPTTF
jgi:hypothetical protein